MLVAQGSHVLLAPCDTPFLQPALLSAMLDQACRRGPDAVVCRSSRGLDPLPGVFHTRLLPRLETQIQQADLRLRTLLDACRTTILPPDQVARHDPQELSFFNINTPADAGRAGALV
jgi:molybdopterin-guanine dinucleotide biosynthesis protein A